METTTTPFDLNRAIQQWRETLASSPAFRRENLDELEAHLRDSVATLQQRELSAEEAFFIAARRAGSNARLAAEFGKINTRSIWLDRALWILAGNLVFGIVSSLLDTISSGVLFFCFGQLDPIYGISSSYLWVALCSGLTHLLMFAGALAICWRLFTRSWGRLTAWLTNSPRSSARFAVVAVTGIVAMILMQVMRMLLAPLTLKYVNMSTFGQFSIGQAYGGMFSSLIESTALVLLAVWLARRRWLATT